ncbi:MAG TPA: ABC transporter ATP-binding protein [Steroidobacteraceae bacterium]|nr:ABC transporter ATP-binding protein [Steroidobacteraceae bacterium]
MTDAALLSVENLSVAYGNTAVVDQVSLSVPRGTCVGVIGESGAGKTQVFLALMGLTPPRARIGGSARLEGVDLFGPSASAVRGREVAMIFQDPMTSLTPHLRIGDQIAEPLVAHRGLSWRDARLRAAELLEQVHMTDVPLRLRQYPHELSGGMRQRAMIAMALACDPKLLIADEPTTALDVSVQAQILALLRELMRGRNMSMAVVTHDMGVIAALADEVLVMRGGQVVERATTTDLLTAPRHEYTRTLLAATPSLDTPAREAMPAGDATLVVRDLGVRYRLREGWLAGTRHFTAVDAVSFHVADGEALGIVGESGSGKSTLTRALMRLMPASAGDIVWLGRPLLALQGEALRSARDTLQIVFQDPFASLDPSMTIGECIAEPLRALRPSMDAGERSRRVAAMLVDVGLDASFATRHSPTLSGGQCQRAAIARAMILSPRLLVCDEAVSALDVSIQAQILDLLARMKRERGTSLIFVSHNLAVVRQLCERVLVMYLGRVIESGPAQRVFESPRHPYTRLLLDSVPRLDPVRERERLARLGQRGETPSAIDRPSGCAFRLRCPAAVERCATTSPEPEDAGNAQQVACLRWREIQN